MVANPQDVRMTVDEWRELERTSEVKHEYIDGYVYAMAGGTGAHSMVADNITGAVNAALGDGPCLAHGSDLATRVSESRFYYADVVVSCSERDRPTRAMTEVTEPRGVFEVLSESTERTDRGRKARDYRNCPTLQEYVLVSTEYQLVEVYRRTEDGWSIVHFCGADDTVELASLGVRFSVAVAYRHTDVPVQPPE